MQNTEKMKRFQMLRMPVVVNTEQRLHSLSVARTAQEMGLVFLNSILLMLIGCTPIFRFFRRKLLLKKYYAKQIG
jgi:hypothetical protein